MIYDRLKKNEDDKVFIPTHVERVSDTRTVKFWNPQKTGILVCLGAFLLIMSLVIIDWPILNKIIAYLIVAIIYFIIIRLFIIEEIYYRKVYNKLEELKNSTNARYWGILTFYDNEMGTAVEFMDGLIGCFVKLERGSVVGQPENYLEKGEDAFSNFLKDCAESGYRVKIIQAMCPASKDTRINATVDKIKNEMNSNIKSCLELNTSYMKKIMENHYFTNQYILVYTYDYNRLNNIVEDVIELTSSLLYGEYNKRVLLDEGQIIDLHLQTTFTDYFDIIKAQSESDLNNKKNNRRFDIYAINFNNGNSFILDDNQRLKLNKLYSQYVKDKSKKIDILDELIGNNKSNSTIQKQQKPVTDNTKKEEKKVITIEEEKPIQVEEEPKEIIRDVEIEEEVEI